MRALAAAAFASVLTLAAPGARADFHGKVVAVADGDTLTVLVDRAQVRVRLAGIDAPERGQPYATAARRSLATLVAGHSVQVREQGRDAFGRVLGQLVADGIDINAEQVRRGYAWVFRRYSRDAGLLALEDEARHARRGVWRDENPVAPWLWRQRQPHSHCPDPVIVAFATSAAREERP